MRSLTFTFILLLTSYSALSGPPSIDEAFNSFSLVPTTLQAAPPSLLSIRFGDTVAHLGNVIEPYIAAYPPTMSFEANATDLHTVLVLDLFKPTIIAPHTTPYLFLLIVNIPGDDVLAGDIVSPYVPPSPIPGTGYHYYVYLVYRQTSRIDTNTPELLAQPGDFTNFLLPNFTSEYNLSNPIAGNFFISRASICYSQPPKKVSKCT